MGDPPSTRAVFLMWQGVASNLGSNLNMRMKTLEAIEKWGWRPWKQVKNENENRPQAWWEQMVQRRDRREWRWRSCELELSCFPALEGKLFTESDLGKNTNCSALILSHLVLHLLPSPDPLFSKISRYWDIEISRYQDIEISRYRGMKISRYQDSGKHCPEMTIFRTGSWYAHESVNFTLFTIHIRLVGNMKQFRGGSKWASGSRTVEVVAVEAAVEPEATTAWQELRCPRASNSSRLTLCRPVLCFLCFVCVC